MHIMLDIETLSTRHDAAILTMAVVEFDDDGVPGAQGMIGVNPKWTPGHRDPETFQWWSQQSERARELAFKWNTHPKEAAIVFSTFFQNRPDYFVWGSPATFDLTILRNWYHQVGVDYPIQWFMTRCLSTYKQIGKDRGWDFSKCRDFPEFCEHDPISDCLEQINEWKVVTDGLKTMSWGAA